MVETTAMKSISNARGARFLEEFEHVVVAGFGRSGRAAAARAGRCGLPVTVVDARPEAEFEADLDALPGAARFVAESAAAPVLAGADLLILSPGIDPRREPYAGAIASGVPVISEIELGWRFVEASVIAVTGSNGKSTVTSMAVALLSAAGFEARACGNIGRPLCDALDEQTADTRLVIEVSSFQLEHTHSFAPDVAVLLNVTPDHQDRYGDFADYAAAKDNLFAFQGTDDVAIVCADDPAAAEAAGRLAARRARHEGPALLLYGDGVPSAVPDHAAGVDGDRLVVRLGARSHTVGRVGDLPLPGPHNRLNGLAALAAALCAGAGPDRVAAALPSLAALPHRLETVGERDGVRFINDSKATNIASAAMALRSFPPGTVHAILGGRDKGADFTALGGDLRDRARAVYLIGEAAPRIAAALGPALAGTLRVDVFPDLAAAFSRASAAARPGETVLLAPACASFDAYAGFKERGEHFRALARQHIEES